MRYRPGQPPCFAPRLPPALTRLTFTVMLRRRHLRVEVGPASVTYIVDDDGPPLQITHHGAPVSVAPGQPVTRDIPALPDRPRPTQPPGRAPLRHALGPAESQAESAESQARSAES
jgi:alpha,alpha-trehalose phosphorylase